MREEIGFNLKIDCNYSNTSSGKSSGCSASECSHLSNEDKCKTCGLSTSGNVVRCNLTAMVYKQ